MGGLPCREFLLKLLHALLRFLALRALLGQRGVRHEPLGRLCPVCGCIFAGGGIPARRFVSGLRFRFRLFRSGRLRLVLPVSLAIRRFAAKFRFADRLVEKVQFVMPGLFRRGLGRGFRRGYGLLNRGFLRRFHHSFFHVPLRFTPERASGLVHP